MSNPLANGFGEAAAETRRTIPFDYTFRFGLVGQWDRSHAQTLTISIEAPFIAESIGYGVVPRVAPATFGPTRAEIAQALGSVRLGPLPAPVPVFAAPPAPAEASLGGVTLGALFLSMQRVLTQSTSRSGPAPLLQAGIRLNPAVAEAALATFNAADPTNIPASLLENLFQVVSSGSDDVQFLYALSDEGSGREFQSQPILSTAGLGISNGDRPFRRFAKPIRFEPKSSVRMEITEKSTFSGDLHVSLHGYKLMPGSDELAGRVQRTLEIQRRNRRRERRRGRRR